MSQKANVFFPAAWLVIALTFPPAMVLAEEQEQQVLNVADNALKLISDEDLVGLTDLMIEEAMLYTAALRDGEYKARARTRQEERGMEAVRDLNERGFDPLVMVSGPVGMVWYPYDFYIDGEWSHCGVDIFTLVRTGEGWKISSMTWSAVQPPECQPHPEGAPAAAAAPDG